ncbi:hypothetical protein ACFL0D_02170 [Thermoproteota archaeon]
MEELVKSPNGQELAILCLDYGYKLAGNPSDLTRDQINFLVSALSHRLKQMSYSRPTESDTTRIIFE